MINQLVQLDTDLWEAWIEFEQFNSACFGTLYVIGEIATGQRLRKTSAKNRPQDLVLEISTARAVGKRTKEVVYTEEITSINQYKRIAIYLDGHLVKEFSEIEIMV